MPVGNHNGNRAIFFWAIVGLLAVAISFVAVRQIVVIERQQAIIDNNARQDAIDKELMSEVANMKVRLESHLKTVETLYAKEKK